jgi:hypothetical protein
MTSKGDYKLQKVADNLFYLYCNSEQFGAIAKIEDAECLLKINNYSTTVSSIPEGLKVAQKIHPLLDYLNKYGSFHIPKIENDIKKHAIVENELSLSLYPNLETTEPGLGQSLISVQNLCCLFLADLENQEDENYLNFVEQLKEAMEILEQSVCRFEKELWSSVT